jgi:hypothetical protein
MHFKDIHKYTQLDFFFHFGGVYVLVFSHCLFLTLFLKQLNVRLSRRPLCMSTQAQCNEHRYSNF